MSDTRTLLVEQGGKKFKITIPADYKVTFGSQPNARDGYQKELRIYEAESKQRACFTGVTSFRDLGLPISFLVMSESGETTWSDDGDGNTEQNTSRKRKVVEVRDFAGPPGSGF